MKYIFFIILFVIICGCSDSFTYNETFDTSGELYNFEIDFHAQSDLRTLKPNRIFLEDFILEKNGTDRKYTFENDLNDTYMRYFDVFYSDTLVFHFDFVEHSNFLTKFYLKDLIPYEVDIDSFQMRLVLDIREGPSPYSTSNSMTNLDLPYYYNRKEYYTTYYSVKIFPDYIPFGETSLFSNTINKADSLLHIYNSHSEKFELLYSQHELEESNFDLNKLSFATIDLNRAIIVFLNFMSKYDKSKELSELYVDVLNVEYLLLMESIYNEIDVSNIFNCLNNYNQTIDKLRLSVYDVVYSEKYIRTESRWE